MIAVGIFVASAVALSAQGASSSSDVFACSFVKDERSDPDSHIVDLRAERRTGSNGDVWLLDFGKGPSVEGKAFDADFGSVGGGTGIEWRDKAGKAHRAFVSYNDMVTENGQKVMFLSLDEPSLWQPPGYVCQTAALKENRR